MLALSLWCRSGMKDAQQRLRPAVRLLLLLTSLLILAMPVTEYVWNFDDFLHGGSDVEFTLLAGLLFAAMVVLAVERSMRPPVRALVLSIYATLGALLSAAARHLSPWLPAEFAGKLIEQSALPGSRLCPAGAMPLRV
jgi:hypothetical protein